MDGQKMMSDSIAALAAALAKAQGQMKAALKDSQNPHFKSSYADLASVWAACRDPLAANGLSVTQLVLQQGDGAAVGVRTMLLHSSGEWLASDLVMPLAQRTAQAAGSALTYARRYALAAMVGVAQDDDDGEAALGRGGQQGQRQDNGIRQRQTQQRRQQESQPAPTPAPEPQPGERSDADDSPSTPEEQALTAILLAKTADDLQAVTKLVVQLGVQKAPAVRAAYNEKNKAIKAAIGGVA